MLSVDLLSEETDLESVRTELEKKTSEAERAEYEKLLEILFPEDRSVQLTEGEEETIISLQEDFDFLFHEDADATDQAFGMRRLNAVYEKVGDDMKTILAYVVGMRGVSYSEVKEAKDSLRNDDVELDFRIPTP